MNYFGQCTFIKSAAKNSQIPATPAKKIAFWGRSNVGKSSLLNSLAGGKVAKVSKTPGRTQLINLFEVTKPEALLCDLPGYGYAKVSQAKMREISKMLESYFVEQNNIDLLCLLLDSRHGLTKTDLEILPLIGSLECPVAIVLTKSDKNSNNVNCRIVADLQKEFAEKLMTPRVFLTSTQKSKGLDKLHQYIQEVISD